jgi:hypothetical protein
MRSPTTYRAPKTSNKIITGTGVVAAAAGCFTYDESSAVPDTLLHVQDACWRGDDGEFFKRVENSRWLVLLVSAMMMQMLLAVAVAADVL